jgi:hypothetical protein
MVIKSLFDEELVQFIQCWWGSNIALGFKGDPRVPYESNKAIERCYNWAANTGVTRGRLHWMYDRSSIGYVVTCQADLLRGLINQFRADIIMSREIKPLEERWQEDEEKDTAEVIISYDEPKIEAMATERANRFIAERVEQDNFLNGLISNLAPVYSIGHMHRVQGGGGSE